MDSKRHEKNSGTVSMKAAQRAAGEWQAELNTSGVASRGLMSWEQFREEFSDGYLSHYSATYVNNVEGSLNVIETLMSPDTLARITEKWITRLHSLATKRLVSTESERRVSKPTVRKYFQHLRTALKWASDQKYIKAVPGFPRETRQTHKGGKMMKGRPITGEKFERMLGAVEKTLIPGLTTEPTAQQRASVRAAAHSLKQLMRGLWLSGLRLGEALKLTWDQWDDGIRVRVDEDGDVCLMIDGGNQKNRQTIVYPVVDDFAVFLLQTPQDERQGFVFNPFRVRAGICRRVDTVSNWIVAIGDKAGVKVDDKDGKEKIASAHDLRRAFGTRWAKFVPPGILKKLMRHSSIETTMNFYVSITAKDTLAAVRRYLQKHGQVTELAVEVTKEVTNPMNEAEVRKHKKP